MDNSGYHIRASYFFFEEKEAAEAYLDALISAFCQMPESQEVGATHRIVEEGEVDPEIEIQQAINLLHKLCVGGCTCQTKSPEIDFHDVGCKYRLAMEAIQKLELASKYV